MEAWLFLGGVMVAVVVMLWWRRFRTPTFDDSAIRGLPDDQRDKIVDYQVGGGLGSTGSPNQSPSSGPRD
jgi:hypothetical protein